MDNEEDFGFSFVDNSAKTDQLIEKRLQLMYDTILPLLDNLCKDSDKSNIYWPNRVESILAFKEKLKKILEGTSG